MAARTQTRPDHDVNDGLLEIARIFAAGVLRLHHQGQLPFGPDGLSLETALETARQDLEQSRDLRLSVSRG
jgi:hypothetical protein